MIVLYVLGYFNRNKQNSYAALNRHPTKAFVLIFYLNEYFYYSCEYVSVFGPSHHKAGYIFIMHYQAQLAVSAHRSRSRRLPTILKNLYEWAGKKHLFLWNLNARAGNEPAISDFASRQLQTLHEGPTLCHISIDCFSFKNVCHWVLQYAFYTLFYNINT